MAKTSTQLSFIKNHWKFRYAHGGSLRNSSLGRSARPLSTKEPIHVVFKINREAFKSGLRSPKNFALMIFLIKKYSRKFFIKVEQISIQHDHVHMLVRAPRRAGFLHFFRVLSGQFSQRLTDTFKKRYKGPKIWKYRPFSRVVKGLRAYRIVRNYIRLNEVEAKKGIYYPARWKGLTEQDLRELWL